jgi:hypothetical protein
MILQASTYVVDYPLHVNNGFMNTNEPITLAQVARSHATLIKATNIN